MLINPEIYQLLFIASIIFIANILINLAIKMYGRFYLKSETRFILSSFDKITLWIALSILFTYIF